MFYKDFAANKLINMYMLFDGADAVGQITQNISVAYLSSA